MEVDEATETSVKVVETDERLSWWLKPGKQSAIIAP